MTNSGGIRIHHRGACGPPPKTVSLIWSALGQMGAAACDDGKVECSPTRAGRFTREGPIGLSGGLNLYGFAGSNPANFSDPFGLCPHVLAGRPCSTAMAVGFGFVPIAGDAYDVLSALAGKDLLTGESIGVGARPSHSWERSLGRASSREKLLEQRQPMLMSPNATQESGTERRT